MNTACTVVVVAGLRAAGTVLLPLLVATFLSILSAPLLGFLLDRRLPRLLAIVATVSANLLAVAALLVLVGGSVDAFSESLPRYRARLERLADSGVEWLQQRGIDARELRWLAGRQGAAGGAETEQMTGEAAELGWPRNGPPPPVNPIDLGAVVDLVGSTLRSLAAVISNAFLVLLMMIFILFEASGLPRKLQDAFGLGEEALARLQTMKREIQRYLGIKTIVSLATGTLIALWVWLLGVDFPLLWGLVAFLFNYIPSLGSILAAVPTILLTLVNMGWASALLVALGYLVVNVVLGNFVEPHFLGRRLGLSTLVVFLSLIFWGFVWGPVGMLLSVPLTMVIKIMLENTEDFRWVGRLLGPTSAATDPPLGGGR